MQLSDHHGVLSATDWLVRTQRWLLYLVPLVLPHRLNDILYDPQVAPHVWYELRTIVIYLVDFLLITFVVRSAFLLITDQTTRQAFLQTVRSIVGNVAGSWWFLLLLWAVISTGWALLPVLSLYQAARLALGLYVALWLAHYVQQGKARGLLLSFTIAAVLHSIIAISQAINQSPLGLTWLGEFQASLTNPWGFGPQPIRGYSLAIHPNNLSGYLLVGLFMCLSLVRAEGLLLWQRIFTFVCLLLISCGILATGARTTLVAAVLAIIAMLLLAPPLRIAVISPFLRLVIFAFGAVIAVAVSSQLGLLERWSELIGQNFATRFTYGFADTIAVIRQNPILGVGHGNLMVNIGLLRADSPDLLLPAHNVFYVIYAELGLVGLMLLTLGCLGIMSYLRPGNDPAGVMLSLCFAALTLIMLLDFYLWSEARSRLLLLWVVGLCWGHWSTSARTNAVQHTNLEQIRISPNQISQKL